MNITCFDDLLTAARTQPQPQTLLMVFVDVELPPDASPQEVPTERVSVVSDDEYIFYDVLYLLGGGYRGRIRIKRHVEAVLEQLD